MILKCTYNKDPCIDSLDLIYTSFGGCYSFNARHGNISTTDGTGPERGLTLLLNVSQDEYSYGPSSSAGFKALVTSVHLIPNKNVVFVLKLPGLWSCESGILVHLSSFFATTNMQIILFCF